MARGVSGKWLWTAALLAALCAPGARAQNMAWVYQAPEAILFAPTVASDGSVYFATDDGEIRGVSPSGGLLWAVDPGGKPSTGMALQGNLLFFSTSQQALNAYSTDGHLAWRVSLGGDIRGVPAVAADGTLFVGTAQGKFYAINRSGTVLWSINTGDPILQSAAIGLSGTIYVPMYSSLRAYKAGGAIQWIAFLASPPATQLALDADENLYFIDGTGSGVSFTSKGKLRWTAAGSTTQTTSASSPVTSSDGIYLNASLNTPAPSTYSITGTVTAIGTSQGLSGVTITVTGGTGTPSDTTNTSGSYTVGGLANGTYTVTPSLTGYSFNPSSLSVTIQDANATGQNFIGGQGYNVSGTVTLTNTGGGLAGVTVTVGSLSATTDSTGNYTVGPLASGFGYQITPTLSGYSFTPAYIPVTLSNSNIAGQNFTASALAGIPWPPGAAPDLPSPLRTETDTTYQFGGYKLSDGTALWPALAVGGDGTPALMSDGNVAVPSIADNTLYFFDDASGDTISAVTLSGKPEDVISVDTTSGPRLYFVCGKTNLYCMKSPSGPDETAPWSQLGGGPRHLFRQDSPPSVTITSPASGGDVSGGVTLSADVSDDLTTNCTVKFSVDGQSIGTLSQPPYALTWYSQTFPSGDHTLVVEAWDSAGNTGQDGVTVTSSNSSADLLVYPDTPPVPFSWTAGGDTGQYRVEFAADAGFSTLLASSKKKGKPWLKTTSWRPGQDKWNKVLNSAALNVGVDTLTYWRVVTPTAPLAGSGGTITISRSVACDGLTPEDGSSVSATVPPAFSWLAEHNSQYRVEVSDSTSFAPILLSSKTGQSQWRSGTSWTPKAKKWAKAANGRTTLYWRVIARDSIGRQTVSATQSLAVTG